MHDRVELLKKEVLGLMIWKNIYQFIKYSEGDGLEAETLNQAYILERIGS